MVPEARQVELVAADGTPAGVSNVVDAHTAPGQLHRAFSVLLIDSAGRTLLQQRAAIKSRFALRWANACCGHPAPRENVTTAATRRLAEELGVRGVALHEVGVYAYRAPDESSGLIEHEYDHVLIGRCDNDLTLSPDPSEVAATRWVGLADLASTGVAEAEKNYAPWLAGVLSVALHSTHLSDIR
ncbi:MAG: isopentenyl-diphosphate Delta-isomerase [Micromonosporaceae bacterium]